MSFQTRLLSRQQASDTEGVSGSSELIRLNQFNPKRYPYLLFSSANRLNNTQFDILLACPLYSLTLDNKKSLSCSGQSIDISADFFSTLDNLYRQEKIEPSIEAAELPFTGGWFVYLAYEMAQEIEPSLSLPALSKGQPLAVATRCPAAIIIDKQNKKMYAIAEDAHAHLLDEIEQDYKNLPSLAVADKANKEKINLLSLIEADEKPYLQQVERIKQYIVDGDIFQANLSRLWLAKIESDVKDSDLFYALSKHNPSSFAAMACLNEITIISSSPERLVSVKNGIVETRPIAGTRPRDANQQSDEALAKELLAHPKEQAEHIMLIDLERNDLGRICIPGSIEVNELMTLESWQHVHHIVSNVRGELQNNKTPIDVLRAVFPGGTITGCPKVHCMEILAEMEQQARGAYTGSLGYINKNGNMDINILIRTMVREPVDKNKPDEMLDQTQEYSTLSFRAGGGIVSDSIAEKELAETRAKAKGLLKIFNFQNDDNER